MKIIYIRCPNKGCLQKNWVRVLISDIGEVHHCMSCWNTFIPNNVVSNLATRIETCKHGTEFEVDTELVS